MGKLCVVDICSNSTKREKKKSESACSVSFFQPSTATRLRSWTQSLGIPLKSTDYVCQFHFKEEHINMYNRIVLGNVVHLHECPRKTLKAEALPTIEHQFRIDPQLLQEQVVQNKPCQLEPKQIQPQPEQEHQQQDQEGQFVCNLEHYHLEKQLQIPEIIEPMESLKQKFSILPQYWLYIEKPKQFEFMRLDPASRQIRNHIVFNEDFTISVISSNGEKHNVGDKISSPDEIYNYLKSVEKWQLCVGTQIEKQRYSKNCKGVIFGEEAYERNQMNPRCKSCRALRCRFQSRKSTCSSTLEKSVACKRRADSYMRKYKRLKKTKLQLKEKIFRAKAECAMKSKHILERAIKQLPEEFQSVVTSCFEAAQKKNLKGRRYTLEWIYECMIIRLKSRNTYELLRTRRILPLPSLSTLNKYIKKISCSAYGFQRSTFDGLKEKCKSFKNSEKRGVVLVDEMKLSENISFDSETMKFNGFVDLGRHTPEELKDKTADHALVFKFVPFRGRWTQSLGCFLSKNACTSIPLHKLIMESIVLLESSGIHVDAVVTDGATWNRGVWKILGIDEDNVSCEHPYNSEQRLWMISDFNHLIKCFRNSVMNEKISEFKTPYGMVKKKHWEAVLEEEKYRQPSLKIAYKLSPAHINPKGFQKMNVPLANQLFGHEVSVAMEHYQQRSENLIDSTPTQEFIKLIHKLIEAMSSRTPMNALKLQENCRQRQAIIEFLKFLEDWQELGAIPVSKSTITGFKVTLRATLEILNALHLECNYSYLMTATISQDPLERFFSVMRFSCGGNDHPDAKMFAQVYRLASCFSLIRPPKGCNVHGVDLLKTLLEVKDTVNNTHESRQAWLENIDSIVESDQSISQYEPVTHEDHHNYNEAVTSEAVQSYIAGYIGRKLKRMLKCENCVHTLEMHRNEGRILARNDVITKMELYGGLFYASDELFQLTKVLENCVLKAVGKSLVNVETIAQITAEICKQHIQTVGCSTHSNHLTKKVIDIYIVMRARFLANSENKRYETAKDKIKMHRKNAKLIT